MDMFKLCRSCMKEVASWERQNFDSRTVEMFCFCTNLKIMEDDKMPKQFCYDCVIKIESSFTYVSKAQEVDAILRNIIQRTFSDIVKLESCKTDHKFDDCIHNYELTPFDNTVTDDESTELRLEIKLEETNFTDAEQVLTDTNIEKAKSKLCAKERKHKQKDNMKEIANIKAKEKYICNLCGKEFTSRIWFNKHMKIDHNDHKYVCEYCNKIFLRKWDLTQHSVCHTDERNYACPDCGKCFKRAKQVAAHARSHVDWRPFECDHCGMKFKFKSALQAHMTVHDGKKPYLCYYCGTKFAQAGTLKAHVRKHTGQKPYSCNECKFRTSGPSSLKRHQRIHRSAKTYVCKHCSKGFYDSSGLIRHIRIHTGELPYKCPNCTRSFIDGWKRKTHLMRVHHLNLDDIRPMKKDGTPKE